MFINFYDYIMCSPFEETQNVLKNNRTHIHDILNFSVLQLMDYDSKLPQCSNPYNRVNISRDEIQEETYEYWFSDSAEELSNKVEIGVNNDNDNNDNNRNNQKKRKKKQKNRSNKSIKKFHDSRIENDNKPPNLSLKEVKNELYLHLQKKISNNGFPKFSKKDLLLSLSILEGNEQKPLSSSFFNDSVSSNPKKQDVLKSFFDVLNNLFYIQLLKNNNWEICYKLFCLIARVYDNDIVQIWPLGLETLKRMNEIECKNNLNNFFNDELVKHSQSVNNNVSADSSTDSLMESSTDSDLELESNFDSRPLNKDLKFKTTNFEKSIKTIPKIDPKMDPNILSLLSLSKNRMLFKMFQPLKFPISDEIISKTINEKSRIYNKKIMNFLRTLTRSIKNGMPLTGQYPEQIINFAKEPSKVLHFRRSVAPVWRVGSRVRVPMYTLTLIWELLLTGQFENFENFLNPLLLVLPFSKNSMIKYLNCLNQLLESLYYFSKLKHHKTDNFNNEFVDKNAILEKVISTKKEFLKFTEELSKEKSGFEFNSNEIINGIERLENWITIVLPEEEKKEEKNEKQKKEEHGGEEEDSEEEVVEEEDDDDVLKEMERIFGNQANSANSANSATSDHKDEELFARFQSQLMANSLDDDIRYDEEDDYELQQRHHEDSESE